MKEDLLDAFEILNSSQMPEYAKEMLRKLLKAFGYEWLVDLHVAWANGGSHTWENVANRCLRCNIRKKHT